MLYCDCGYNKGDRWGHWSEADNRSRTFLSREWPGLSSQETVSGRGRECELNSFHVLRLETGCVGTRIAASTCCTLKYDKNTFHFGQLVISKYLNDYDVETCYTNEFSGHWVTLTFPDLAHINGLNLRVRLTYSIWKIITYVKYPLSRTGKCVILCYISTTYTDCFPHF